MRILATVTRPSSGRVLWNNSDIARSSDALRDVLGYSPQVNHIVGIDFTGTASGAHANHDALIYFALSGVLLGAAFVGRARQLRSD